MDLIAYMRAGASRKEGSPGIFVTVTNAAPSAVKTGEYLYVQCGEGNGRTGTVVACLLGLAHGLASSQALDLAQVSCCGGR